MIAGLRGVVDETGPDFVLVNVGGVVFQVFAPSSTLAEVTGPGSTISLHTHMQMREDGVTLYGFATRAELQEFQLLIGVTGVGPRIALALPLGDPSRAVAGGHRLRGHGAAQFGDRGEESASPGA